MKVPANRITVGMITADHGVVTGINHHDGPNPVVIEGEDGLGLHERENLVEVIDGVYRLQKFDPVLRKYRDLELYGPKSCWISDFERADAALRKAMHKDPKPRKYRLLKADDSSFVYEVVDGHIVVTKH